MGWAFISAGNDCVALSGEVNGGRPEGASEGAGKNSEGRVLANEHRHDVVKAY